MRAWWRWLVARVTCSHTDSYRERRLLHGVFVLHFVCADCGHASPAMNRTDVEHQQIVQRGQIVPVKVKRSKRKSHPATVTDIRRAK